MPNPSGSNQLGQTYSKEAPYGSVQKQNQLQREAPMSGAPVAAIGAPDRARKQGGVQAAPAPQGAPAASPGLPPPGLPATPEVWAELARTPGASPLVREYAARAQGATG